MLLFTPLFFFFTFFFSFFPDRSAMSAKERMMKQKINRKFVVRLLKKNCHNHLKCFSKSIEIITFRKHVFDRQKKFKKEREKLKDDSRSGRPSTSRTEVNVKWLTQVVYCDHRLISRMITSQLNVKKDSVWDIVTEDSGIWKVCAKLVPKLLNVDQ